MMNKNRLFPTLALAGATSLAAMLTPVAAMAVTFNVNRSWSQGTNNASLVGTVDVSVGSYTIQNGDPNPFTNVNLTLIVDGTSYTGLTDVFLNLGGTGRFLVNATSSVLTFNTTGTDTDNPAVFIVNNPSTYIQYAIGSRDNNVELSRYTSPDVVDFSVALGGATPVTFGTAQQQPPTSVPEPTATVGLLGLGWLGVGSALKRMRKSSKSSRVR